MSALTFIAFHMRDYQRDTQQLPLEGHGAYFLLLQHCWTHGRIPLDDAGRAAICKVTPQRWRRHLAPLVAGYFNDAGENKRATAEIERAEKYRTRQAMAGHRGGLQSAAVRQATAQATASPPGKPRLKPRSSHGSSHGEAIKRKDITTTFSVAARASGDGMEPADQPSLGEAPQSGLATGAGGDTGEQLTELQTVMLRKGWVKPC